MKTTTPLYAEGARDGPLSSLASLLTCLLFTALLSPLCTWAALAFLQCLVLDLPLPQDLTRCWALAGMHVTTRSSSLTSMSFRLEQKHHFFKAGCSAAFTQKKPHCGPLPLPPLCQGCLSSALCDALLPLPLPDTPVRQGTGHEYGCPLYGSQF